MKRECFLWVGTFNYSHEVLHIHRYAPTWASAKVRMLRDIAKQHEVNFHHVFAKFDGSQDNFRIEKEERVKTRNKNRGISPPARG